MARPIPWGPTVSLVVTLAIALMLALLTGLCFSQPSQQRPNRLGSMLLHAWTGAELSGRLEAGAHDLTDRDRPVLRSSGLTAM